VSGRERGMMKRIGSGAETGAHGRSEGRRRVAPSGVRRKRAFPASVCL